jgi:hypothetical protein
VRTNRHCTGLGVGSRGRCHGSISTTTRCKAAS